MSTLRSILKRPLVAAVRNAPDKKSQIKRAGAKAIKAMERVSTEYILSSKDATKFRALSARANFLAQDRGDIQHSTKELCREFAVPNRNSYTKLLYRGLGKIRHLDVTDLWCQEQVRIKALTLHKVLGSENPADIMTKYVDLAILNKMLLKMNLHPMDGRAAIAPAAEGCTPP